MHVYLHGRERVKGISFQVGKVQSNQTFKKQDCIASECLIAVGFGYKTHMILDMEWGEGAK